MPQVLLFRLLVHSLRVGRVQCQGLFTDHVQPGLQRVHDHLVVLVIGRAYHDGVKVTPADHVAIVRADAPEAVLAGHFVRPLMIAPAQRGQGKARICLQHWQVSQVSPPARSNDADSNQRCHVSSFGYAHLQTDELPIGEGLPGL